MKRAIVYSSKTGNTKKVAEAIFDCLDGVKALYDVREAPEPNEFDWLILGFWVNRGLPEKEMINYMEQIRNKNISIFMTLGAYPDSTHAKKVMAEVSSLLAVHNQVAGQFICQGKIDPALTERLYRLPKDHPHYMDEGRIERHKEAAKHPDSDDLARAQNIFRCLQHRFCSNRPRSCNHSG